MLSIALSRSFFSYQLPKCSDFQARNYGVNSQPYYVLLDNDENRLAEPYGFNTNIDEFLAFLDKGIEGYKAGK
jgi:hypothetical protein